MAASFTGGILARFDAVLVAVERVEEGAVVIPPPGTWRTISVPSLYTVLALRTPNLCHLSHLATIGLFSIRPYAYLNAVERLLLRLNINLQLLQLLPLN
jgi:hypothetical protein